MQVKIPTGPDEEVEITLAAGWRCAYNGTTFFLAHSNFAPQAVPLSYLQDGDYWPIIEEGSDFEMRPVYATQENN